MAPPVAALRRRLLWLASSMMTGGIFAYLPLQIDPSETVRAARCDHSKRPGQAWVSSVSQSGCAPDHAVASGILPTAVSQIVEYSLGVWVRLYAMRPRVNDRAVTV